MPYFTKLRVLKALTVLQHGSATFLSVFVTVHVAAPAFALIGGSTMSSQVMLLGREYYQTALTEPLFVWLPLAVHVSAAFVKRAIIGLPKSPSALGTSGWLLAIAFLPIHLSLHRFNPTSPALPIASLGPSQVDFEFVKVGLAIWPVLNWTLYSGIVVATMFHAVEGSGVIFRYWKARAMDGSSGDVPINAEEEAEARRKRVARNAFVRRATASAGISTVLAGLGVIATEPLNVSRVFMGRIESSFMLNGLFRRFR
ncbi:hypothetical protein DL93DRAFT_2072239 [Clavulina sp. PMI_390]|nr:hypothetical protein DL93DRAFT_2072239 [Clavulina sp. PMI_390]